MKERKKVAVIKKERDELIKERMKERQREKRRKKEWTEKKIERRNEKDRNVNDAKSKFENGNGVPLKRKCPLLVYWGSN